MKQHLVIFVCLFGALTYALPVSENNEPENIDLVQIPLKDGKELDILTLGEGDNSELSDRNKRTIGILRDLFPELSKQVEQSVNKIVGQLIRAIGPAVLRSAVQGNSASRSRNSFDSDFTDDDDSDSGSSSSGGTRVMIELPSFDDDEDTTAKDDDNTVTAGSSDSGSASSTTEPSYVYTKKVDESTTESGILSISLNSDLINRTDENVDKPEDEDGDDSVKGGNNNDDGTDDDDGGNSGNSDDANDKKKNNDTGSGDGSSNADNGNEIDNEATKDSTTDQSDDENIV